MDNGYVALLDVLGFSALVGADTTGDRIRGYRTCLEQIATQSVVEYIVFSDSIILTAKGADEASFIAIARECSHLLAALLKDGIALRGAITFGDIFRSHFAGTESIFVAGCAVVDAYQFEQNQDWVGIMVAPNALKQVRDLRGRCTVLNVWARGQGIQNLSEDLHFPAYIQPCGNIPFRSPSPLDQPGFDGFAVVATNCALNPAALSSSISATLEDLSWLRSIAPSPSAQQKYISTIRWLTGIQGMWQDAARNHQQFVERKSAT